MKLVVFMPALNEEKDIRKVIRSIPRDIKGINVVDVLVVDDGSTDNTAKEARLAGAVVVSHPENRGVGSAFQTGTKTALELGADIVVNIDADGQFSPDDISKLIKPIIDEDAEFVASDRFTGEDGRPHRPEYMSAVKYWGNMRMSQLVSTLAGRSFPDVSSGFRAYSKEALLQLNVTGKFTYTQEVFLDLATKGMRIKTIPVVVKYFPGRKSRVAASVIKYAFRTSKIIFRTYRDYKPLSFFGGLSLLPLFIGTIALGFIGYHYLQTGTFTPYKSVAFAGIYLVSLALVLIVFGILADMFVRIRMNQEKILYMEKKRQYE